MKIGAREPKCATFFARYFLYALVDSMPKTDHNEAHGHLRFMTQRFLFGDLDDKPVVNGEIIVHWNAA